MINLLKISADYVRFSDIDDEKLKFFCHYKNNLRHNEDGVAYIDAYEYVYWYEDLLVCSSLDFGYKSFEKIFVTWWQDCFKHILDPRCDEKYTLEDAENDYGFARCLDKCPIFTQDPDFIKEINPLLTAYKEFDFCKVIEILEEMERHYE